MSTRTIQFLGQGYGNTPVSVNATWNGNTVYNGIIPTLDELLPNKGFVPAEIMFTQDVDLTLQATIPMSIEVLSGTLVVGPIVGNYATIYTQTGNTWAVSSSGPNTYITVNNNTNNNEDPQLGDVRSNVLINGQPVSPARSADTKGTWCYRVPAGSTITFDVDISSGIE